MKVVLFCGGKGMRMRDYSETIPKPMVEIGYRPILWNIMKFYAHYGHKEFILALGYGADKIKNYFINYNETLSNDFIYTGGGKEIQLLNSDIDDWKITFVDTGTNSNIGMRLLKVREHLKDEEMFLANYADGLSDVNLTEMIEDFSNNSDKTASFMTYQPPASFHMVRSMENGLVNAIQPISNTDLWINTGYFIFKQEFFDYINNGEEIVEEPFERLVAERKLMTYRHKGYWQAMDTFKDKMLLDDLQREGHPPWAVWKNDSSKEQKKALK